MATNRRLLFYSDARSPGGAEVYLSGIVAGAVAAGFAVDVCAAEAPTMDSWCTDLARIGAGVEWLPALRSLRPVRHVRRCAALVRRGRYAAVHFNQVDPWSCTAAILAARTSNRRLLSTSHLPNTVYGVPAPWRARVAPRFLRRTILVGQCHFDALRARGEDTERFRVVRNGVPIPPRPTPADRARARDALGLDPDAVIVGTVGRLTKQKDHATLLRAATAWPEAELILIGDGPERDALGALADRVGARVRFAGRRADAHTLIPAFDVFALPSRYEGLPLVLLEALAAGTPVVASDLPEIRDVVTHDREAILTPAGDDVALGRAVAALLGDRESAQRLADAGRTLVAAAYSQDRMVRETLDVIREVIA